MYQLELMSDDRDVTIEIFEKQVDIVKKYGIGDRGLRNTMSTGSFSKGRDYTYRCTYITDESKTLEGDVERKPKLVLEGDLYTITYGKDKSVSITEDELSKIRKLYCGKHSLTIEQLGLEMNLLREEIIAIKTAFNFVKSSIPYTDKEIDEKSVDEMAEETRIHKKKAYFRKLEDLKVKDMENELKKLHQKDYYWNKFLEISKSINIVIPEVLELSQSQTNDCELIAGYSDWHIGAKCDNHYNKYNITIANERLDKYFSTLIKNIQFHKPRRVIITDLGDDLNGLIHESNRADSDMTVEKAYMFVVEKFISIILAVRNMGIPVVFGKARGNHSRLNENKKSNVAEENFEDLILWTIKYHLKNVSGVHILPMTEGMFEIEVFDRWVCGFHGDNITDTHKLSKNRRKFYEIGYCGHFHNFGIKTTADSEIVTVGSLMGSDSYASNKQLYSKPSQLITIIDSDWNKTYIPVYLD